MLTRCMQTRMLRQRFGQHPKRALFEILIVWSSHDVPIFLEEKSELKSGQFGSKVEFVKLLDRDGQPFTGKMWRL